MAKKDAKKEVSVGVTEMAAKLKDAMKVQGEAKARVKFEFEENPFEEHLPEGISMKQVKALHNAEQKFACALEQATGEKVIEMAKENKDITGGSADVKVGNDRISSAFSLKTESSSGEDVYGHSMTVYRAQAAGSNADMKAVREKLSEDAKALFS